MTPIHYNSSEYRSFSTTCSKNSNANGHLSRFAAMFFTIHSMLLTAEYAQAESLNGDSNSTKMGALPSVPKTGLSDVLPAQATAATFSAQSAQPNAAVALHLDNSATQLAQLEEIFKHYDSEFSRFQLWGGLAAIGAGAVTIPMGFAIRNHSDSIAAPVVLGLGAGEVVGGAVLLLGSSGSDAEFAKLSVFLTQERSTGKTSVEILRSVEEEWKRRADASQSMRRLGGVLGTSVGIIGLGTGTYFALSDVSGTSASERATLSALCLGVGGVSLMLGIRSFFFENPVEIAWRVRNAGRVIRSAQFLKLGVSPAPLPGGGAAFVLSGRF